jgi:MFS family permease
MTGDERRASVSLASIFALRMLGLFLVLPVFALEARKYPGGDDAALLGLAMGIYGLTQAALQLPLGMASDRFGRKRVIVLGLLVFAAGSFLAASADTLQALVVGRSLQGAGAISAAVSALLADLTRDEVRTKAMALVGASIGLMFAVSLVAAPVLNAWVGLHGLFALTGALALLGVFVVWRAVPAEPVQHVHEARMGLRDVLKHSGLRRLNVGVFVLHAVQLAMWMAVPALLVQAGLSKEAHWQVYLPAVGLSFLLMGGVFALERRGHLKTVMRLAIVLMLLVQLGLMWQSQGAPAVWPLGVLLFLFFAGFNVMEATQPSLVTRMASSQMRGAAMGLYNTLQSLGFFVGGGLGGLLVKSGGAQVLFLSTCVALLVWLTVVWRLELPARPEANAKPA